MKRFSLSMVVAGFLVLVLSGCIRVENKTLVMPDGSGKVTIEMGFNEQMFKGMAAMMGGMSGTNVNMGDLDMDLSDLSPTDLEEGSEGFVAFSRPEQTTENGWKVIKIRAYFEDINKVKVVDKESGREMLSYSLEKQESGYKLTVNNQIMADLGGEEGLGAIGGMGGAGAPGEQMPPEAMARRDML